MFRVRFIPACAGNTSLVMVQDKGITVHPRVCGEHSSTLLSATSNSGSSPRVRGTQPLTFGEEIFYRFIPACAGTTVGLKIGAVQRTVHPRVCGEHTLSIALIRSNIGSSPRVRGTLFPLRKRSFLLLVHPRVCGEHVNCNPSISYSVFREQNIYQKKMINISLNICCHIFIFFR